MGTDSNEKLQVDMEKLIYNEFTVPLIAYLRTSPEIADRFNDDKSLLSFARLKFTTLATMVHEYSIKHTHSLIREIAWKLHKEGFSYDDCMEIVLIFLHLLRDKNTHSKESVTIRQESALIFCVFMLECQKLYSIGSPLLAELMLDYVVSDASKDDSHTKSLISKDIIDKCHIPFDEKKVSAAEFLESSEINLANINQLSSLALLQSSSLSEVERIEGDAIKEARKLFSECSSVLKMLPEFSDLSFAFGSISDIFSDFDPALLDQKSAKLILVLLRGMISDLENWISVIFAKKEAKDIHFLDASLLSSIAQLESVVRGSESVNDDNDLELF